MTIKRKRGRPRKPFSGRSTQVLFFEPLEDRESDPNDTAIVAGWFRSYLTERPNIQDPQNHLQQWMNAAADAIEAGDAVLTGHYAFHAIRARAILAQLQPVDINEPVSEQHSNILRKRLSTYRRLGKIPLIDLAAIGLIKLQSDKKRGHRGTDGGTIEFSRVTQKK